MMNQKADTLKNDSVNLQKEIMNKNSIINMLHRQLNYFQGPDADDDDGNDTDADAWCFTRDYCVRLVAQ